MAFDINSFKKPNFKPALNRLADKISSGIIQGLPTSTKSIASNISESLLNSGSSYSNVDATSSVRTDTIVSGADPNFFAIAGSSPERTSGASIASLRRIGSESVNQYLSSINPTSSIQAKRSRDEFEVLSVV